MREWWTKFETTFIGEWFVEIFKLNFVFLALIAEICAFIQRSYISSIPH